MHTEPAFHGVLVWCVYYLWLLLLTGKCILGTVLIARKPEVYCTTLTTDRIQSLLLRAHGRVIKLKCICDPYKCLIALWRSTWRLEASIMYNWLKKKFVYDRWMLGKFGKQLSMNFVSCMRVCTELVKCTLIITKHVLKLVWCDVTT